MRLEIPVGELDRLLNCGTDKDAAEPLMSAGREADAEFTEGG
jgi:hypothetical protein